MILAGKGCRDSQGEYVPVPQCNPRSMPHWGKNTRIAYKKRKRLTGGLSRAQLMPPYGQIPPDPYIYQPEIIIGAPVQAFYTPPVEPDPGSYQQVWDFLWSSCVSMMGEDACSRLLGHTPFVCPVDEPRRGWLIPLVIGIGIGKILL